MIARKKIVLTTFGSFGDIHPYMAIANELRMRGHDPVIATMALYREKIEAAGIRFAALRPNIPPPDSQDQELVERIMDPKSGPRFLMEEVIFPHVRDSYEDLRLIIEGHDLLVTHPITFAGPLVAYKTGIPWVSTVLAPTSFFSAYDPPVPPICPWLIHLKVLGPGVMKLLTRFAKSNYTPRSIHEFRDHLGIADYGNPVFEGQHSPARVLALFSSVFARSQPDWPPQARVTGFAFYDGERNSAMPDQLVRFLDSGPAPIVFTLGSSAVWVAKDFFQESVAAAQALNRRAVLLIGDERNLPAKPLPPEIIAVNYAPYDSLLPRSSLMVHHGGVGTTSQALRAGTPTLIVPFAFDQFDNAAHVARLGTSRTIYRSQYSSRTVEKELGILLERPQYARKAKEVSDFLHAENGAAVASDLIEEILKRGASPTEKNRELAYASGD